MIVILLCSAGSHAQSPQIPEVDSVSINANGNPVISWFPNSDNTSGYVIVQQQGNFWQRIDTLFGIAQTSYTDVNSDACSESKWYRIYAFAGPTIPDSPWSDTLRTIFLQSPQLDICGNFVTLNWTAYVNMVPQLEGYRILASEDGGPYTVIGTVSAGTTTFVHTNLSPGVLYTYKIRAFNPDGSRTSTSCGQSILVRTYSKPGFAYIRYATVENNEHIRVDWIADEAPISKFKILRSDDGVNFTELAQNVDETAYNPSKTYIDTTADFNSRSYYYRIDVCDSCGFDLLSSENTARTIHLAGLPNADYENELSWNEYEGWDLEVNEYRIFRRVNDMPNPTGPLEILPAGTTSYIDDVSDLENSGGTFAYFVVAYENEGDNGYEDFKDVSSSNEITIVQETRVLVPNAFMPGAAPPDDEFRPMMSFVDQDDYDLMIFNKWGQMIFSATDISEGWDGTYNGEPAPADAYVYLIRYKTPEGQVVEKRGTVTLVR